MRIQHNISAMVSNFRNKINNRNMERNLEKLSSGYRINNAADDAAGLSVSEKMRTQILGLRQATHNTNNGISLIQVAEGAITEQVSMLQRINKLAVQSLNGTYSNSERNYLQQEVNHLLEEIDRITQATTFGDKAILTGTNQKSSPIYSGSGGGEPYIKDISDMDFQDFSNFNSSENFAFYFECKTCDPDVVVYFNMDEETTNIMKSADLNKVVIGGKGIRDGKEMAERIVNGLTEAHGLPGLYHFNIIQNGQGQFTFNYTSGSGGISFQDRLFSNDLRVKIQAGVEKRDTITIRIAPMNREFLFAGNSSKIDVSTQESAGETTQYIRNAISYVSLARGRLGSVQNRLEYTRNHLGVTRENLTASESRIRDTDMAKEMMKYTKNNILSQSSKSMLIQANLQPQSILKLVQ